MERFCKIIETPSTQVLYVISYNDEDGEEQTILSTSMVLKDGTRAEVRAIFTDDDQEEKANQAMAKMDLSRALKLVSELNDHLTD